MNHISTDIYKNNLDHLLMNLFTRKPPIQCTHYFSVS